MKKLISVMLALCLCVGLCACGTVSEPDPQEALHTQVLDLIAQGDYIQASTILSEHPEFEDYAELTKKCGLGVIPQYVKANGEEKEPGKYFLKLVDDDGTIISLWHMTADNSVQFLYSSSGSSVGDSVIASYILGEENMVFIRTTTSWGATVNTQDGKVSVATFTGTFTGSMAENADDKLEIPGLTVTAFTTAYDKQTRMYHIATMRHFNDMLNATYKALTAAGYKGTLADIGFTAFTAYDTEK